MYIPVYTYIRYQVNFFPAVIYFINTFSLTYSAIFINKQVQLREGWIFRMECTLILEKPFS